MEVCVRTGQLRPQNLAIKSLDIQLRPCDNILEVCGPLGSCRNNNTAPLGYTCT